MNRLTGDYVYYSRIPDDVLNDLTISDGAKVLYIRILSLSKDGFCWAKNSYLAKLSGVSSKTIGNRLAELDENGWIERETTRDKVTHQVIQRRIIPKLTIPANYDEEAGGVVPIDTDDLPF